MNFLFASAEMEMEMEMNKQNTHYFCCHLLWCVIDNRFNKWSQKKTSCAHAMQRKFTLWHMGTVLFYPCFCNWTCWCRKLSWCVLVVFSWRFKCFLLLKFVLQTEQWNWPADIGCATVDCRGTTFDWPPMLCWCFKVFLWRFNLLGLLYDFWHSKQ